MSSIFVQTQTPIFIDVIGFGKVCSIQFQLWSEKE